MRRHRFSCRNLVFALAALFVATGCASTPSPAETSANARPNAQPTKSITRFDAALSCMDTQFADYGVTGVVIAVSGVPDYTGRAYVGSDLWLQAAINRMSQRSNAFTLTDVNPNPNAPEERLFSMLSDKRQFYYPAYYIRGAISGFAEQVAVTNATAALGAVRMDAGIGRSRASSIVSVDLQVGDMVQRRLIGRTVSGNEIVLQSRSAGAQLGGRLSKLGANLEFSSSAADGVPQAVRALIELGAIESLGRLAGTPYWACLGDGADPGEIARIRADVYANMSVPERIVFVQRRLGRLGLYSGPLDGVASPALSAAVRAYGAERGLAATQPDDFNLYVRLTEWRADTAIQAAAPMPAAAIQPAMLPQPALAPATAPLGFGVALETTGAPGAAAALRLSAARDAYAYCYLQEHSGSILKVFPNRWQPDPLVRAGRGAVLPAANAGFQLVLPKLGQSERVVCVAAPFEVGRSLPAHLLGPDLTPLSATSLDEVIAAFRSEAVARASAGALSVQTQWLKPR